MCITQMRHYGQIKKKKKMVGAGLRSKACKLVLNFFGFVFDPETYFFQVRTFQQIQLNVGNQNNKLTIWSCSG